MKLEKSALNIGYFTLSIFIGSNNKLNRLSVKKLICIFYYSRVNRNLNFYNIERRMIILDDRKLIR